MISPSLRLLPRFCIYIFFFFSSSCRKRVLLIGPRFLLRGPGIQVALFFWRWTTKKKKERKKERREKKYRALRKSICFSSRRSKDRPNNNNRLAEPILSRAFRLAFFFVFFFFLSGGGDSNAVRWWNHQPMVSFHERNGHRFGRRGKKTPWNRSVLYGAIDCSRTDRVDNIRGTRASLRSEMKLQNGLDFDRVFSLPAFV